MNRKKVRELLAALQEEVRDSGVDAKTRESLQALDEDIHKLLEASKAGEETTFELERVKELEARFAANHPNAERFVRELLDTLAKLGV